MPAYKDEKRNTWYAAFYYTDWKGIKKHKVKRGFAKKGDAKAYETEFLNSCSKDPDITFGALVENYMKDMETRLKPTTIETKRSQLEKRVLPYFKDMKLSSIDTLAVRRWQNEMMTMEYAPGKRFAPTYLKSLHAQLSCIFNYAVLHYNLAKNPCRVAGSMGKSKAEEMTIWTQDEFESMEEICKHPAYHLIFNTLFYSGCRISEALAFCPKDFKDDCALNINKQFIVIKKVQMIITPKSEKSIRCISIPEFLYKEAQEYIKAIGLDPDSEERIFYFTRSTVSRELTKHAKKAGLVHIRVHDLRHSHASMLIHMGVNIKEISERLGHENVQTTLNTYAHLYPKYDEELAKQLHESREKNKEDPSD